MGQPGTSTQIRPVIGRDLAVCSPFEVAIDAVDGGLNERVAAVARHPAGRLTVKHGTQESLATLGSCVFDDRRAR